MISAGRSRAGTCSSCDPVRRAPSRVRHGGTALHMWFPCGEHHPYDPEEDDVVAIYQHIRRIESIFRSSRLFRRPNVENGHSAERNGVSTSSSCLMLGASTLAALVRCRFFYHKFPAIGDSMPGSVATTADGRYKSRISSVIGDMSFSKRSGT